MAPALTVLVSMALVYVAVYWEKKVPLLAISHINTSLATYFTSPSGSPLILHYFWMTHGCGLCLSALQRTLSHTYEHTHDRKHLHLFFYCHQKEVEYASCKFW